MSSIQEQQTSIYQAGRRAACGCGLATVITLTALTIIACAALCLTLPGVNALSQIVYPVICPCVGGLVLAIPFWLYATKNSRRQTRELAVMENDAKELLDQNVPYMLGYQRKEWILETLLPLNQGYLDGSKIITSLTKLYPDKVQNQKPKEKRILRALNLVQKYLQEKVTENEWDQKIAKAKESFEKDIDQDIAQMLKNQEDDWEDSECIEAIRCLIDYYPDKLIAQTAEVARLEQALEELNASMYGD